MTRLSLTMGDQTTTVERTTDLTMFEMLELFQALAFAAGFHVESWKQAVTDMADMYNHDDIDLPNSDTLFHE